MYVCTYLRISTPAIVYTVYGICLYCMYIYMYKLFDGCLVQGEIPKVKDGLTYV